MGIVYAYLASNPPQEKMKDSTKMIKKLQRTYLKRLQENKAI